MESLAAVGLAANIIQFIEIGTRVVKRLHDFSERHGDVPEVFRGINVRLPLLIEGFRRYGNERIAKDAETETALA